jgi:hypothetical protein
VHLSVQRAFQVDGGRHRRPLCPWAGLLTSDSALPLTAPVLAILCACDLAIPAVAGSERVLARSWPERRRFGLDLVVAFRPRHFRYSPDRDALVGVSHSPSAQNAKRRPPKRSGVCGVEHSSRKVAGTALGLEHRKGGYDQVHVVPASPKRVLHPPSRYLPSRPRASHSPQNLAHDTWKSAARTSSSTNVASPVPLLMNRCSPW